MNVKHTLARRLIDRQFPELAREPLHPVAGGGTVNTTFRLGDRWVARFPSSTSAGAQLTKEIEWLPRLAPKLPLPIPVPVFVGKPSAEFDDPWVICAYIAGDVDLTGRISDSHDAAATLADFLEALWACDTANGPRPGFHNFNRGVDLSTRHHDAVASVQRLPPIFDRPRAREIWEAALEVGPCSSHTWIHGDLHGSNIVCEGSSLVGVLDFGGACVGDRACDVMSAWTLFGNEARQTFRARLDVDDATWARGAGWALSFAAGAYVEYAESNPVLGQVARSTLERLLATSDSTNSRM